MAAVSTRTSTSCPSEKPLVQVVLWRCPLVRHSARTATVRQPMPSCSARRFLGPSFSLQRARGPTSPLPSAFSAAAWLIQLWLISSLSVGCVYLYSNPCLFIHSSRARGLGSSTVDTQPTAALTHSNTPYVHAQQDMQSDSSSLCLLQTDIHRMHDLVCVGG